MPDAKAPATRPGRTRAPKAGVKAAKARPAPVAVAAEALQPVVAEPVMASVAAIETPTSAPPQSKEPEMATAFENTQDTVKATVHQINAQAEAAMNNGKAAMEQVAAKSKEAVEASLKSLDEMTEMARGNVEALMASARAATAGIEQISAHVSEVSKKAFDDVAAAVKAMTAAKTPNELLQLQSDFTKTQFDSAVAEFSKMTEMMVKLTGEVMEPVQNRMALAADKLKASFTK